MDLCIFFTQNARIITAEKKQQNWYSSQPMLAGQIRFLFYRIFVFCAFAAPFISPYVSYADVSSRYSEEQILTWQNAIKTSLREGTPLILAGGWTSGGGGGVICGAKTYTLDTWEKERSVRYFMPNAGEKAELFLRRVLNRQLNGLLVDGKFNNIVTPVFNLRLEQAIFRVVGSPWIKMEDLPHLNDTGKISRSLGTCAYQQMIIRLDQVRENWQTQPVIFVNKKSLQALAELSESERILQEAALILHEAIYLLGRETGELTSEKIRKLVNLLLSENLFNEMTAEKPGLRSQRFYKLLGQIGLGNILRLSYFDETQWSVQVPLDSATIISIRAYTQMISRMMDLSREVEVLHVRERLTRYAAEEASDHQAALFFTFDLAAIGIMESPEEAVMSFGGILWQQICYEIKRLTPLIQKEPLTIREHAITARQKAIRFCSDVGLD